MEFFLQTVFVVYYLFVANGSSSGSRCAETGAPLRLLTNAASATGANTNIGIVPLSGLLANYSEGSLAH